MARYQVKDGEGRKAGVIEWDGEADLGDQYDDCIIEPDDGSPIWAPPVVRIVDRRQLYYAVDALGKATAFDGWVAAQKAQTRYYFQHQDRFPESNSKFARAAQAIGVTVAAWVDLALTF